MEMNTKFSVMSENPVKATSYYLKQSFNRNVGVMVSMLASSAVDHGIKP
jgi:hypothetical protein